MKIRVKLIAERIIEVKPENYPPNSSTKDIMEMERRLALEDPYMFVDFADKVTTEAEYY